MCPAGDVLQFLSASSSSVPLFPLLMIHPQKAANAAIHTLCYFLNKPGRCSMTCFSTVALMSQGTSRFQETISLICLLLETLSKNVQLVSILCVCVWIIRSALSNCNVSLFIFIWLILNLSNGRKLWAHMTSVVFSYCAEMMVCLICLLYQAAGFDGKVNIFKRS